MPASVRPSKSWSHLLEVAVGRRATARPVEERGRDGVVPGVGEAPGDVLDVVVHTERLVDDDHRLRRATFGHARVEPHRAVGGVEGDVGDLHALVLARPPLGGSVPLGRATKAHEIDEPWCGTRQPNITPTHHYNAATRNDTDNTTSTNPLTRPHSFRNAVLAHVAMTGCRTERARRTTASKPALWDTCPQDCHAADNVWCDDERRSKPVDPRTDRSLPM